MQVMKHLNRNASAALLSVALLSSTLGASQVGAAEATTTPATTTPSTSATSTPTASTPAEASTSFVDHYKNNKSDFKTEDTNPALRLLSEFNKLWKPGASWDSGTKLNSSVLDANIQKVADIAASRTAADEEHAYLSDRRSQSYSVIDGLGSLTDIYRENAGAVTTITSVAQDATSKKYDDEGNNAGDPESKLGKVVTLVNTLRGEYSSSNPSKNYFNYKRPFRWADDSLIIPTLLPAKKDDPTTDGGFPSGHTNAAYLTAFAMAYAVPERYQELLASASELGDSRVVAGMHSPMDVMGGRVLATALSAAILNDPEHSDLKKAAYEQAHEVLLTQQGTANDLYTDTVANEKKYMERLTYGFAPIQSTTAPAVVPKGAEVLLETRQPYLDAEQRRTVLATTALPSGYPLLDDEEGWGRLNLYAAADGFGSFPEAITVNMDGTNGGFHALDSWRNHIAGVGGLTKTGSGTLKLEGNNSYSGGTVLEEGILVGASQTAFGKGDVTINGGTLQKNVSGELKIQGNLKQSDKGTLELHLSSNSDVLTIQGAAELNGKLRLVFENGYVPAIGSKIISYGAWKQTGDFTSIETVGLPESYQISLDYKGDQAQVNITRQ